MKRERYILHLQEVGKSDVPIAGGKGASLGELYQAGISVPEGFVVPAHVYTGFLERAGLKRYVREVLEYLAYNDAEALTKAAKEIKEAILGIPMPPEIADDIREAYRSLGEGLVAVRSSATAEDLPDASFAGQQSTFLNISGGDNVVLAVQECWASLFEPRAIFYRVENGFDHLKVGIAVVVQRMVQSQTSGVLFTADPISNDRSKITIEAGYGLGEAVVSGAITPDHYVVDKEKMRVEDKRLAIQNWMLVRNPGVALNTADANIKVDVPQARQQSQKLSDDHIVALAQIGKEIEELYGHPQDIEWAQEDGHLYVVQSRPITTLGELPEAFQDALKKISARVLVRGSGASPGMGPGPVKIIKDATVIHLVKKGDVLVTEMTTPDFVPAMKRASAIVTNKGGRTCHAAIVSRELGVPCVVGTENATRVLRQRQQVTVDGAQGVVYEGILEFKAPEVLEPARKVKTATRVYVNLADPELADVVAARNVDGVGLLRAEFIIRNTIGVHPMHALHTGKGQEWTDKLAQGLE
ncbi:MAG: phosphoenolpyruvate synthase, partial [Chloroflexi bacterium]|nr:phosphoenolpyruvate synthase [Chloroflexota bacterium]